MFVILDDRSSPAPPLGDAVDMFVRLEDAERFVEQVRGAEPELASYLADRRSVSSYQEPNNTISGFPDAEALA